MIGAPIREIIQYSGPVGAMDAQGTFSVPMIGRDAELKRARDAIQFNLRTFLDEGML